MQDPTGSVPCAGHYRRPRSGEFGGYHSSKMRNIESVAGMVFIANDITFKECLDRMLFGLPIAHMYNVERVRPGLPLFLFDNVNRYLYGVFRAISNGARNIE